MLVELVLFPVTFTGAAVGSEKKVHQTGLEISQKQFKLMQQMSCSEGSTGLK